MATGPAPVPKSTSPKDLGFTLRKRMVSWYDPRALIGIAIRDAIAAIFGTYADKRDQQASLKEPQDPGFGDRDELWFDMVGDMGEAFGPTHAVAWHLAQPALDVPGAPPLPRGELLVLLGDEVYPTGSIDRYENQMMGPYDAAWPAGHVTDDGPVLLALPGNHDWYDGLTSFLRVYCQRRSIGGWRTQQTRSYFAARLPHNWVLWALDTQLGGWLDAPQLAYFTDQAALLEPDDRLILLTPVPFWLHSPSDGSVAATVAWFKQKIVPPGNEIKLYATGDWHHYARYESPDGTEQRLTIGGGGAFLHPTHNLPRTLEVPGHKDESPTPLVHTETAFPSRHESRSRLWLVLAQAFLNPVFSITLGLVDFTLAWLIQSAIRPATTPIRDTVKSLSAKDLLDGIMRSPLAGILCMIIFLAWFLFPRHTERSRRTLGQVVGAIHGVAHVALTIPVILLAARIAPGHGFGFGLAFALSCIVIGGLAGATLTGAYLFITNLTLKMHDNEAFSALRLRSFKCFARIHIAPNGTLTVYPIGIRRVHSYKWKLNPHASPGTSWFARPDGVQPELIEKPFVVGGRAFDTSL